MQIVGRRCGLPSLRKALIHYVVLTGHPYFSQNMVRLSMYRGDETMLKSAGEKPLQGGGHKERYVCPWGEGSGDIMKKMTGSISVSQELCVLKLCLLSEHLTRQEL